MNITRALIVVLGVAILGCGDDGSANMTTGAASDPLVGTWDEIWTADHASHYLYVRTFSADGTFAIDTVPGAPEPTHYTGHWEIVSGGLKLTYNWPPGQQDIPVTNTYSITPCTQGTCLYLTYDRTLWSFVR